MKTAVARYVRENNIQPVLQEESISQEIKDLCASFQDTVIRSLLRSVEKLADEFNPNTFIVAGGVACNGALKEASEKLGRKLNLPVYFPSKHLSTDNAAMIAAAGHFHLKNGETDELTMTADVTMRLQNFEVEDLTKKKVRYRL